MSWSSDSAAFDAAAAALADIISGQQPEVDFRFATP